MGTNEKFSEKSHDNSKSKKDTVSKNNVNPVVPGGAKNAPTQTFDYKIEGKKEES